MKTEWVHKKLGECCNSELGKTLDEGRNTGSYRPYLCALNVLWGKIDLSTIKQMRIEEEERERYLVKKGDLLVCEGGEIGRCAIWESDDEIYYQNALHRVRFFKEYDARFFMYLLCHYNDLKLIEQYGKGLTIKHLNQAAFRNIPVCVPDLPAQRRIAAILSSADKVIDTTRRLIGKYKQMKQGMMEDLLKPKEGWKMVRLGEVCERITDGSHDSPKAIEDGHYMPSVKDMSYNRFDFSSCKQISENDYLRLKNSGCKPDIGDVLIAKDGSILKYCFVVEEDLPIVILSSIAILKPKQATIDSHFLAYYFQKKDVVNDVVENYKSGTGVPRIVLRNFEKIEITYPEAIQDQRRIAAILSGIDAKIAAEEKVLEKYEKVKKGLMERLLEEKEYYDKF